MKIARMQNNVVVNIELVSEKWYNNNTDDTIIAYDNNNPAFIGGDYVDGKFYPPQPYSSWNRDGQGNWNAPIPYPDDANRYIWNEETLSWVKY